MRAFEYWAYWHERWVDTFGRDGTLLLREQDMAPSEYTAVAKDLAQEISFLEYRLAVLRGWPDSERRSALIDATTARLWALREMR